jgi:hypothetical protein
MHMNYVLIWVVSSNCLWKKPKGTFTTGGSLHSQVEHHVRDKFVAPILYGIDNPKIMMFFLHIHNH